MLSLQTGKVTSCSKKKEGINNTIVDNLFALDSVQADCTSC